MIENIIFDYGDTLIRFDQDAMLAPYVPDAADRALMAPVLFDRLYWDRLDVGAISREELLSAARARLPRRLWKALALSYDNWYRNTPEMPGMAALAHRLKAQKKRLFLLSNISVPFAEHVGELPILRDFDGMALSGPLGVAKPDPAIFEYLFKTYRLDPAACFFVDDRQSNIDAAAAAGMRGYRFDGDAAALEAVLATVFSR